MKLTVTHNLVISTVVLLSAGSSVASPARDAGTLLPADALAYVEIEGTVEVLELLEAQPAWQAAVAALSADGSTGVDVKRLGQALSDPVLRSAARDVAGTQVLLAVVPSPNGRAPTPVVVLRGPDQSRLHELLSAWNVVVTHPGSNSVQLLGPDGAHIAHGRVGNDWTVLGPPWPTESVGRVADRCCFHAISGASLTADAAHRELRSLLPEHAQLYGYVDPRFALDVLQGAWVHAPPEARLFAAVLDQLGPVAVAREITPDRLRTWAVTRPAPGSELSRLVADARQLSRPISPLLPDQALLRWELGASPALVARLVWSVLAEAAPTLADGLVRAVDEVGGLHTMADLIAAGDRGFAVAVLRSEPGSSGWPLLRPVVVLRVGDPQTTAAALAPLLAREAGAVSALSRGLISASPMLDRIADVDVHWLRLEALTSWHDPLPSPAVAVVGDLVVASPVRSGVLETVESIRSGAGVAQHPVIAVETLHVDLHGLASEVASASSTVRATWRTTLAHVLAWVGDLTLETRLAEDTILVVSAEIDLRSDHR